MVAGKKQNVLVQQAVHRIRECHGFLSCDSHHNVTVRKPADVPGEAGRFRVQTTHARTRTRTTPTPTPDRHRTDTDTPTHTDTHTHTHTHTHTQTDTHTHTKKKKHTHIYIYIYIYTRANTVARSLSQASRVLERKATRRAVAPCSRAVGARQARHSQTAEFSSPEYASAAS